ncbi:MAG: hypothetical protein ACJ72Q_13330 [Nitrososphaeraceae archaeon]|jgi:hypothetical protein
MLSVERTLFTIIFLKEYSVIIDGNMFTKRTMAALFTIAIASSLIVVSGGFVGSAFAKKASGTSSTDEDKSSLPAVLRDDSPKSKSTNADDSSGSTGDISGSSAKDLKSLSKCQSGAAEDGDLTQAEVTDCYSQVF